MVNCPACGAEVPDADAAVRCPACHLDSGLFEAVRDAAGPATDHDPTYLRTIAELLATVDLGNPAPAPERPALGLLSRPARFPSLRPSPRPVEVPPPEPTPPLTPLRELPALPSAPSTAELRKRVEEYFQLGRRLGLDFTDFERRSSAATISDDDPSLEVLSREMFIHLASAIAEEYESVLARRNELAQLTPTPSADIELDAVQRAIAVGDLGGAQRRLVHVRDQLLRAEEEWEVGRILVTECDLLAQTLRELGGDPAPALGPIEEGRRFLGAGRRTDGERLLARGAVALWALLEPKLFEDLRRVRDRMVEARSAGVDVGPAIGELRTVASELRQRNFVGAITAYHRLRSALEPANVPDSAGRADGIESVRPSPSA